MSAKDGTHTLTLEFSRSANYEIIGGFYANPDSISIEAEFVDEVLIHEIRENFSPEDIFTDDELKDWAENYAMEELE